MTVDDSWRRIVHDSWSARFRLTTHYHRLFNNYSMSSSWIWSDKIANERVARVGYNHIISNKGEWNNCFSKFSNRVLPPIFISTILQSVRKENLAHYFPYDVKLGLLAHSRRFLANQKAMIVHDSFWSAVVPENRRARLKWPPKVSREAQLQLQKFVLYSR